MIENITEYNDKILKEFVKLSTKKQQKITVISSIVILICGILEILFAEYIFGGACIALGIFFFCSTFFMSKIALKKSTAMPKIKNEYKFYPDKLDIVTYSNNAEIEKSSLLYSVFSKVIENNEILYLYLNNLQAIIVDCSKFKESSDKLVVKKYIDDFKNNKK